MRELRIQEHGAILIVLMALRRVMMVKVIKELISLLCIINIRLELGS